MSNDPLKRHQLALLELRERSSIVSSYAELLLSQFKSSDTDQHDEPQKKLLENLLILASSNWNQALSARQSIKSEINYLARVGVFSIAQSSELCRRLDTLASELQRS